MKCRNMNSHCLPPESHTLQSTPTYDNDMKNDEDKCYPAQSSHSSALPVYNYRRKLKEEAIIIIMKKNKRNMALGREPPFRFY